MALDHFLPSRDHVNIKCECKTILILTELHHLRLIVVSYLCANFNIAIWQLDPLRPSAFGTPTSGYSVFSKFNRSSGNWPSLAIPHENINDSCMLLLDMIWPGLWDEIVARLVGSSMKSQKPSGAKNGFLSSTARAPRSEG
jgi:hypothetical protein